MTDHELSEAARVYRAACLTWGTEEHRRQVFMQFLAAVGRIGTAALNGTDARAPGADATWYRAIWALEMDGPRCKVGVMSSVMDTFDMTRFSALLSICDTGFVDCSRLACAYVIAPETAAWLRKCRDSGFAHGSDLVLSTPGPDNVARARDELLKLEGLGAIRRGKFAPTRQQRFFDSGGFLSEGSKHYAEAWGWEVAT